MENVKLFKEVLETNELNYLCSIFLNANTDFGSIPNSQLSSKLIEAMQEENAIYGDQEFYWDIDIVLVQNKIRNLEQTEVVHLVNAMSSFKNKIFIVTKREVVQTKTFYKTNETLNFSEALEFFEILEKQVNSNSDEFFVSNENALSSEIFIAILNALRIKRAPMAVGEKKVISTKFCPLEVWSKK